MARRRGETLEASYTIEVFRPDYDPSELHTRLIRNSDDATVAIIMPGLASATVHNDAERELILGTLAEIELALDND